MPLLTRTHAENIIALDVLCQKLSKAIESYNVEYAGQSTPSPEQNAELAKIHADARQFKSLMAKNKESLTLAIADGAELAEEQQHVMMLDGNVTTEEFYLAAKKIMNFSESTIFNTFLQQNPQKGFSYGAKVITAIDSVVQSEDELQGVLSMIKKIKLYHDNAPADERSGYRAQHKEQVQALKNALAEFNKSYEALRQASAKVDLNRLPPKNRAQLTHFEKFHREQIQEGRLLASAERLETPKLAAGVHRKIK